MQNVLYVRTAVLLTSTRPPKTVGRPGVLLNIAGTLAEEAR